MKINLLLRGLRSHPFARAGRLPRWSTTRWSNWECDSRNRVRTTFLSLSLSFSLPLSWSAPTVDEDRHTSLAYDRVYTVQSRVVSTDKHEAVKVSLGVSLPVLLRSSHVCVNHVDGARTGVYMCIRRGKGTVEGTKEGREGRGRATLMATLPAL